MVPGGKFAKRRETVLLLWDRWAMIENQALPPWLGPFCSYGVVPAPSDGQPCITECHRSPDPELYPVLTLSPRPATLFPAKLEGVRPRMDPNT